VTFNDTTYKYLLRRPKSSGHIHLGYTCNPNWYISLGVKFASDRYDVGGYQEPDVKLDGSLILNAYASYKLNRSVEFFTDLQNITNTHFFEICGFSATPFTVSGGIRVKL
ncbi:MAG TPA: TonB-dependent receptor, partial [Chitinophagaceae bacterium]|nr:TonB-dependent receptor [Chitinophagaceae bacterium]